MSLRECIPIISSAGSDKICGCVNENIMRTCLLKNLGVTICPYCDEEYLDVVENGNGGKLRTLEIDHFFPKGKISGARNVLL